MIEGNTTILIEFSMEHLEILTDWNFNPEINKHLPKRPKLDWDKQKSWLQNQIEDNSKEKYIIHIKDKKTPVGVISAMNIDRKNRTLEYGITIGEKDYWGKGISKDASIAFLNHYFKDFELIYLRVYPENERAISFFEGIGFMKEGLLRNRVINHEGEANSFLSMSMTKKEFKIHV